MAGRPDTGRARQGAPGTKTCAGAGQIQMPAPALFPQALTGPAGRYHAARRGPGNYGRAASTMILPRPRLTR